MMIPLSIYSVEASLYDQTIHCLFQFYLHCLGAFSPASSSSHPCVFFPARLLPPREMPFPFAPFFISPSSQLPTYCDHSMVDLWLGGGVYARVLAPSTCAMTLVTASTVSSGGVKSLEILEVSSPLFHDLLSLGLILCGRANDDCYLLTMFFCPRTYGAFYSDVCIVHCLNCCILCGSLHTHRVPANWIFYLLFLLPLGSTYLLSPFPFIPLD